VPFDGEDAFSIGYKHIMEEVPVPPLASAPERELFEIVKRMMAKAPDDRYQSAKELASLLQSGRPTSDMGMQASLAEAPTAVLRPSQVEAALRTPVTPTTPTTPMPETPPPPKPQVPKRKKKRGGVLMGLFLVLFMGAGGAGGYWYFVMDAQWPLPFMQQSSQPDSLMPMDPADSLGLGDDSLMLAFGDSLGVGDSAAAAADSVTVEDSTGALEDTAAVQSPLPETGMLVLENVTSRGRVFLNGRAAQGTRHELPPGSVSIRVTRTGYEDFETSVAVPRGDTVSVGVVWEAVEPPPVVPQCANPVGRDDFNRETYNLNNYCWDAAPRVVPQGPWYVPIPEGVDLPGRPSIFWVQVQPDGSVGTWRLVNRPRVAADGLAARWAQQNLSFRPATKNGQPVAGWVRVVLVGRRP
jgi:hypothetical protein